MLLSVCLQTTNCMYALLMVYNGLLTGIEEAQKRSPLRKLLYERRSFHKKQIFIHVCIFLSAIFKWQPSSWVFLINQRAHISGKLWFLPINGEKYESRKYKTLLLTFIGTRALNPSLLCSPWFMTVIKQDILSGLYATVYFKMVVKTSVSSQTHFTARLADITSTFPTFSTKHTF